MLSLAEATEVEEIPGNSFPIWISPAMGFLSLAGVSSSRERVFVMSVCPGSFT